MSTSLDEDVFTFLTEDFEIACDSPTEFCDSEKAKYVLSKKCCAEKWLIGEICKEDILHHTFSGPAMCYGCGRVGTDRAADFFDIVPL